MANCEKPLVSVVALFYNQCSYACETAKSLFSQTYGNCEIILSDDCSTDGTGNKICKPNIPMDVNIHIFGDGNEITILTNACFSADIWIGSNDCPCNNCKVIVGDGTTSSGKVFMRLMESGSQIQIGRDCMFSSDISLHCSDTHTLLDNTGKILNVGRFIKIGNHVWIGQYCTILKNTSIADGCVVGMHSIVTREFTERSCVIAGSPAKIQKNDVHWDRMRPQQYIENCNQKNKACMQLCSKT